MGHSIFSMYFAYGSNLCIRQMNKRCQDNLRLGEGKLQGYRWIITTRGYANIVKSPDDEVWGVIYQISEADESELDIYEGIKKKLYIKQYLKILSDGRTLNCLTYVDPVTNEGIPTSKYASIINEGISDSNLPEEYVTKYLKPKIKL